MTSTQGEHHHDYFVVRGVWRRVFLERKLKETIFAFTCIMLCDNTFSSFTCTVHNPYSVGPTDQKVAHYSSFSSISLVFKILMKPLTQRYQK